MLSSVSEIVDFNLYPYGNARMTQNADGTWKFSCQHGVSECTANMYQACAMDQDPDPSSWWPMVICMEKSRNPVSAAQNCATNAGLNWEAILECAGDDPSQGSAEIGNPLMHGIGQATADLVPAHQWTPWVVMNGKPLSSSQLDKPLKDLVCGAYTGTKPAGCASFADRVIFPDEGFEAL